jgi:ATP phosphoribosyltransferase regulatory subunit
MAGLNGLVIDLADARICAACSPACRWTRRSCRQVVGAVEQGCGGAASLAERMPAETRHALHELLTPVRRRRSARRGATAAAAARADRAALDDLQWLATHLQARPPGLRLGFDLSDMSGYAYYSGTRFALYGAGCSEALVRGGRYDEVGAVFGRNRPAVGFSLDLKVLAEHALPIPRAGAVLAPWSEDPLLRAEVRRLREAGETVVCMLPGHAQEAQEFDCDRELVAIGDHWVLRAI